MATIVLRAGKGSPLTNAEVDANFTNLNTELGQKLVASSNLSDLANATTARTNLGFGNVENKSSATIRSELTSGNVTTALGYTPVNKAGDTITGDLVVNTKIGIGSSALTGYNLRINRSISGATTFFGVNAGGAVQSDVTATYMGFRSLVDTAAAAFTLGNLRHFQAQAGVVGVGSSISEQVGFIADSSLTTATTNIGFRGLIPSGANRWNMYMDGTASNFLGGNLIVNAPLGFGAAGSPGYGTSGQFLRSAGSAAAPSWGSLTSGEVTTALGFTPYNATNPSSYITASASITGSSNRIAFLDNRNTNDEPQGKTGYSLSADFKVNSSVNSPPVTATGGAGGYSYILTVAGWDTYAGSGGWPSQLSIGDGIAVRQATSATVWGAWRTVLHSNNFSSYALPLSGGTLTGQVSVRDVVLGSGYALKSGTFARIWEPGQAIGSASYAGLYGLASTYNAQYSAGWKSLGGGTASAITIEEGIFSFSASNAVAAANAALTWSTIIQSSATATNIVTGALLQNGNQVLHAGNYTTYSPSLTGTGASGSWGISVTGNSATATALQTARTINGVSFNGTANITVADSTKLALTGGTLTGKLNSTGGDSARLFESLNASASNAIQFYIEHNLAATNIGNARGALNIVSPSLTGTPTAPTAAANTNTTQIATTAFVSTAVGNVPVFAAGTLLMFAQAAAPTGWTQVTTDSATNRMLRVVNTAGAGVGGSHSPILNNVVPSHTHGFSTGGASANHNHSGTTGTESAFHQHQFTAVTYSYYDDVIDTWSDKASTDASQKTTTTASQNVLHYHGFDTSGVSADHSHSGATDNGSSQTNWTPRYIDMILCSKN